jgi:hypothetical protein
MNPPTASRKPTALIVLHAPVYVPLDTDTVKTLTLMEDDIDVMVDWLLDKTSILLLDRVAISDGHRKSTIKKSANMFANRIADRVQSHGFKDIMHSLRTREGFDNICDVQFVVVFEERAATKQVGKGLQWRRRKMVEDYEEGGVKVHWLHYTPRTYR